MTSQTAKLTYTVADLTDEQREAILAFATQHGRTWKEELRSRWHSGWGNTFGAAYVPGCQQIRNRLGPSWLAKFRLPNQTYRVVRYDVRSDGCAVPRLPVQFDNLDEAVRYVWLVRDAVERWGDNSLVGLYQGDRCIPVNR